MPEERKSPPRKAASRKSKPAETTSDTFSSRTPINSTSTAKGPQSAPPEHIRERAYFLYLERGSQPGHEMEDWLRAEREMCSTH